jgi:hypothetical protein
MKQCPWCAQEMPDSATFCEHCGPGIVPPAAQKATPVEHDTYQMAPAPPPPAPRAAASRAQMLAMVAAVAGAGTVTFAMLVGGGSSSQSARSVEPRTLERSIKGMARLATGGPRWNSTNREWLGSSRKGIAFELPAGNKVAVWQRQVQPTLVVRCLSNRTDVFVYTDSAAKMETADENHTVRVAFDGEPDSTERWPDADEHDALFAPDGAAFARRLMTARTMRFGFTPHNASPVVAEFYVTGLAELIEPVVRQCGWDQGEKNKR